MLKICIFGGGAIGGYLAGHLARAGLCEVSVVARGSTLDAIQTHGLRVRTPDGEFVTPVRAVADARELGRQDYVFVTLKAHQVDAALDQIAALMDRHTVVLPPTTGIPYYFFHGAEGRFNDTRLPGIDPGGRQWQAMPPQQVVGCVYWIGAHTAGPGVVVQDGEKAGCPIGELDGSLSPRVQALSEMMTASGLAAKVNTNIRSAIWVKFVNSLCWNPVALLTQATLGAMADTGDVVPIVKSMMEEADAVAAELGLHIGPESSKRIAMTLTARHHRMSMLQDLDAGRPLELDPLQQSLLAVRALTGIRTPTLDTVLALARLRAHSTSTSQR
ncbi:ketopantoate reductase family protein [Burkholderia pseudomultivorans]|uniref:2-dehydropantoate 2-reductase n=1 Tax=Burkholderia pseudomultivorans TaxID=1207504 RepID=A0A132EI78_9BURK|nr:2-dehydropantoate 2-reductase [Burkholderia pseudomultivorans]KWF30823.1 2-dehydropantoate 2-reductase [Burkholderia pseudomultivorans]